MTVLTAGGCSDDHNADLSGVGDNIRVVGKPGGVGLPPSVVANGAISKAQEISRVYSGTSMEQLAAKIGKPDNTETSGPYLLLHYRTVPDYEGDVAFLVKSGTVTGVQIGQVRFVTKVRQAVPATSK